MISAYPEVCLDLRTLRSQYFLIAFIFSFGLAGFACGQTASTGALVGVTLDPSGAIVGGATIHLTETDNSEKRSAISNDDGQFGFLLLPPGTYQLQVKKADFRTQNVAELRVHATETLRLEVHLELATHVEHTQVFSAPFMVQLDTSALGRVVNESAVSNLPLVSRNYTQICRPFSRSDHRSL